MVPLGDPRSARDPFAIDCPARASSRWADSRTWVHSFDEDLPAGLRCRFDLRPGLLSLAGRAVGGAQRFEFTTGGPAVQAVEPSHGAIAEDQRFALRLDGEPTRASLERHVFLRAEGLPDPIGVRVVDGEERATLLASERFGDDWKADDPRVLVLEARQRFAPGSKVVLHWGPGVASLSGVATEEAQTFAFDVRPHFSVRFSCERVAGPADCVPLSPIRLVFSAPVPWDAAERIVLRAADGSASYPAQRRFPTDGDPFVDSIEFRGPFPPRTALRAELPEGLADDAGRTLEADAMAPETRTGPYPALAKFASPFGVLEAADPVLPVTLRRLAAPSTAHARGAGATPADGTASPPHPASTAHARSAGATPADGTTSAAHARSAGVTPADGTTSPPHPASAAPRVDGSLAARHVRVSSDAPADLLAWLHALARSRDETSLFASPHLPAHSARELALPAATPDDSAEVVGLPLEGPGLHLVEIESRILGEALLDPPGPFFVAAGALVTNLAVHFKSSSETSLAWVTSLDRGEPVPGARVRVADCTGAVLAEAETGADGVALLAGLPAADAAPSCDDRGWSDYASGLLVVAALGDDRGLAHTSWSDGIEPWRFGLPTEWSPTKLRAATVFDRTLFRAGETVHMKHVLRRPVQEGFAAVPAGEAPTTLRIVHLGSGESWDLPLDFAANGSAESEWAIPRHAKLGSYELRLLPRDGPEWQALGTGSFRVEAFRVPLARAVIQPPAGALVAPREFPVDVAVRYLAGGGAAELPVVLRSQVRRPSSPPSFGAAAAHADLSEFSFGAGGVREGVRTRRFSDHGEELGDEHGEGAAALPPAASQSLVLDAAGTARARIGDLPATDALREVVVELEFRDPNGATQTAAHTVPLWPASRVVGLRSASVRSPRDAIRLEGIVLGLEGEPLWLAGVSVEAFERRSYAARKRVVGGFYAYENIEEIIPLGVFCSARSDRSGRFACEDAPPAHGDLVFVARSSDWAGRASVTQTSVYVPGDDAWFAQGDGDRMDLLPERRRYEPGETARFQVRMPFRDAHALVSVEREGVAEHRVVRLSGKRPHVELPVGGSHAPNVFVSVLAVRGRAAAPPPTATLDLGRPAYRLGIAEIEVGRSAHALAVKVVPERTTYRVRETARVRVSVRAPGGGAPPAGTEIALAAVDEGLLELMPNESWRLLDALMGRRAYGVRTSTAQLQVVGKRHFGRKAIPAGGGGGQRSTRELFDTLLLWRARVPLDAQGDATLEIPLNDSLTSFRVAAVATGGAALFGTGEASFRTTQDLMILAGLPPLVREGDRLPAGVTVRNTTDDAQSLTLRAQAGGIGALEPITLELEPGAARELSWEIEVPAGVASLPFEVEVAAASGASDRLRVAPRVVPAVPERVLHATLVQLRAGAAASEVPVERPAGALADRGGLEVSLRPRLADGSEGIERAMAAYPYTCLEQQASVAVALRDRARWDAVMEGLSGYLDDDGLARFFPVAMPGSDVLTAYLVSIADEAGLPLPAAPLERMLAGLTGFVQGSLARREPPRGADLPLRKLAALAALARHGKATPELVGALAFQPALLTDSGLLDWIAVLERAPQLPRRDARLREAERLLRARLTVHGTTLGFASSEGGADWLLATPDAAAARLVLSRLAAPAWRDELPRLVRAALALQRGGAWPTTTGNAWGVLALGAFSAAHEQTPVAGESAASLAGAHAAHAWAGAPDGALLRLPWPPAAAPLALRHRGSGAPWALVQAVAALPLREPLASGYRIERRVEPVSQRTPGVYSRGDVARVRVEIVADADASWVVASDPIPAGATLLGGGLGGGAGLLAAGERDTGAAWEAYTERSHEGFRRYYQYVPEGRFSFEYTVRFDQAGRFQLPPTRVEAMYSPERMGEWPNAAFEVAP